MLCRCCASTNKRVTLWSRLGSNQRPSACEADALPLSYETGIGRVERGRGLSLSGDLAQNSSRLVAHLAPFRAPTRGFTGNVPRYETRDDGGGRMGALGDRFGRCPAGGCRARASSPPAAISAANSTTMTRCGAISASAPGHHRRSPATARNRYDYGQGIILHTHGTARFVCAGDTAMGFGPVLGYGQYHAGGGMSCNSEQSGMRCSNSDGHGFTLSRQGYHVV